MLLYITYALEFDEGKMVAWESSGIRKDNEDMI